jgi:ornithine carbamoyltransferase
MRHFLKETDLSPAETAQVFAAAAALKAARGKSAGVALAHQSWGLMFFKKSTRTRVSFQVGVHELGGQPVMLNADDLQISRGETVADTARVLSRYLHGMVIRCHEHSLLAEFARCGTMPIVNALSDFLHPCQFMTDMFTLAERYSPGRPEQYAASLKGKKVAFLGDTACNMANSWILGANLFGMKISLSGPAEFAPGAELKAQLQREGFPADSYQFTTDPYQAVKDADVVYTDVWVSMGKEDEKAERIRQMSPYAVTAKLFAAAKPDALFMHCLPAHPGEEVEQAVLDNPRSIIFDQAENRLHTQKAIMAVLAKAARK